MIDITTELFELQDLKYRDFHAKLMPTVDVAKIIGIRVPQLRRFSKEFAKRAESTKFLKELPHKYYEEDNVHAFLIGQIKDFDQCVSALDEFLPHVDNWATCDGMSPRVFAENTDKLLPKIEEWLKSKHTYQVRFAIGMLMKFYLDAHFNVKYLDMVASVRSNEYYINMMIAWYFATALAKQWTSTIVYIENHRLEKWTHNKAIQKARESFRISAEQKEYLNTLKLK